MIKKVLVGLNGSPQSEQSLPWVMKLFPEADVTLLQVVELAYTMDHAPRVLIYEREERSKRYLSGLGARFTPQLRTETRLGSAAHILLEAAQEFQSDLLAITTHGGSTLAQRVFGGTAEKLIHTSPLPLLVVPAASPMAPPDRVRRILVPLDGSEESASILPLAESLAQRHQAEIVLLHVLDAPVEESSTDDAPFIAELKNLLRKRRSQMEMQLSQQAATMSRIGLKARWKIVDGKAAEEIVKAREAEEADVVVMSAHGYGGFKRMVLGSVAGKVLRSSPAPVLVARSEALIKAVPTGLEASQSEKNP